MPFLFGTDTLLFVSMFFVFFCFEGGEKYFSSGFGDNRDNAVCLFSGAGCRVSLYTASITGVF